MTTIVCSCGKEFHFRYRSSSGSIRSHFHKNSGHKEVLRFSFKDPRLQEEVEA